MSGAALLPWRDSPVGGHGVPAGLVVALSAADAPGFVARVVAELADAHFREEAPPAGTTNVRVLRRGTVVGDTLMTGAGLALLGSKLGPLSLRAIVVVEAVAQADDSVRVVAAMVAGDALAPEVARAVDAALADVPGDVSGPGWMRAVDVPADSLAHPREARRRGIR
jgi:hypothetical protein